MDRIWRVTAIGLIGIGLALLLAACANNAPPAVYAYPTIGPNAAQAELDARATLAVVQSIRATETAVAQLNAISSATAAAAAMQTRDAAAAATSTREAFIVEATYGASTAVSHQATMQAAWLEGTRVANEIASIARQQEINDRYNAALVDNEIRVMEQESQATQLTLERRAQFNRMLPAIIAVLFVASGFVLFFALAYMWRRGNPVIAIETPPERQIAYIVQSGYSSLTTVAPKALPAPVNGHSAGDDSIASLARSLPAPNWNAFLSYNNSRYIPLGVGRDGPVLLDIERKPHLVVVGATGSGKSTGILQPVGAAMLGLGMHVLFMNGRGSDFNPFLGHHNATVVRGDWQETPQMVAHILDTLVEEASRRDQILREHNVSSWSDLPQGQFGPAIGVVIDEFLRLARARSLGNDGSKQLLEHLITLTAEARKFGIHVVLTATDPTSRALGPQGMTIRGQCARIVFRLEDVGPSQALLGDDSAVGLPRGVFIGRISGPPVVARAFYPPENGVQEYLDLRPIAPAPLPEAVTSAVGAPAPQESDLTAALDAEALLAADYEALSSPSAVAQLLAGKEANPNDDEIQRAIRALLHLVTEYDSAWAASVLNRSRSRHVKALAPRHTE